MHKSTTVMRSDALQTALSLIMASRTAQLIWWGAEHYQFANRAAAAILGPKATDRQGVPASAIWREQWTSAKIVLDGIERNTQPQAELHLPLDGAGGSVAFSLVPLYENDVVAGIAATALHQETGAAIDANFAAGAEVIPHMIWRANALGGLTYANERVQRFFGRSADALAGHGWMESLHPLDVETIKNAWQDIVAHKKPGELEFRLRSDGEAYQWVMMRVQPEAASGTNVTGFVGTFAEIDRRRRSEQIRSFAAGAIKTLAAENTIDECCRLIADIAATTVAEFCIIDVINGNGGLDRIAWSHRDPRRLHLMSTCTNCPPFCGFELEGLFSNVFARRDGLLIRDWEAQEHANGEAADPSVARWLEISSFMSLPLLGRKGAMGVMTLARAQQGDLFEQADLAPLQDVAQCIGTAFESMQSIEHHRAIADRFQIAALPKKLPEIPGMSFRAVYEAAQSESFVGGDWYDAFRLLDGRVVISIGDVMGNGLDAAVTMGAVRQSIRGAAQIYPNPVTVLNAADRALRAERPDSIVTAFVGVLDPLTLEFEYACAGHPPPLVRLQGGTLLELIASDLPLGLRTQTSIAEQARYIQLTEPALFVFYTDGVTEATHDIRAGEMRLRETVSADEIFNAENAAAAITAALRIDDRSGYALPPEKFINDDLAILTLRVHTITREVARVAPGGDDYANWTFAVGSSSAARAVRNELAAVLRGFKVPEFEICDVELVFSELVGNIIRHAGEHAEIALDLSSEACVLHVLDRGPGFTFHAKLPNDVMSESGRGLFIAMKNTRELNVTPRHDGGSHARAVLNVTPLRKVRVAGA